MPARLLLVALALALTVACVLGDDEARVSEETTELAGQGYLNWLRHSSGLNHGNKKEAEDFMDVDAGHQYDYGPMTAGGKILKRLVKTIKREKSMLGQLKRLMKNRMAGKKQPEAITVHVGQVGPPGARGPRGARGKRGPKGFRGATGPKGVPGDKGRTGRRGMKGVPGPQGRKGKRGRPGMVGRTGHRGQKGPQGPQGPIGFRGYPGPPGPPGRQGGNGHHGPPGPKGPHGPRGRRGPRGYRGPRGKIVTTHVKRGFKMHYWHYGHSIHRLSGLMRGAPHRKLVKPMRYINMRRTSFGVPHAHTFALRIHARIFAPRSGVYHFYTASDDGSNLYVDRHITVRNGGLHGWRWRGGSRYLTRGLHNIRLEFFENHGDNSLRLDYAGPGIHRQLCPVYQ